MKQSIIFIVFILSINSCSLFDKPKRDPSPLLTVKGTISKLAGTVVLQNNGKDDLSISSDGVFEFKMDPTENPSYNITVKNQPAGRTCIVSNGSGAIENPNITDVTIKCGAFYGIEDETPLSSAGSWEVQQ